MEQTILIPQTLRVFLTRPNVQA